MERDPPSCANDPSSSDSKSDSDGGNRVGLGGDAGICKFRILDVQNLRDGGDGTEPESESSIVVVKVEPVPTTGSPSQGEMGPGERKGLLGNALPTSNTIHVKEEMSEDSFNANEIQTPIFKMSFPKNDVTFFKNALQQHKEGDGVKSTDYKQKYIHGHEHTKIPTSEKIHMCTVCNQTFRCISTYQMEGKNQTWKPKVKLSSKTAMSPRTRMRLYRERLKKNDELYQMTLEAQRLRSSQHRLKLKDAGDEVKERHREVERNRQKRWRDRVKESGREVGKAHMRTRENADKMREYWKKKKRESRERQSAQKRRRIKEKDKMYRRQKVALKGLGLYGKTSVQDLSDFPSDEAKRQAAFRMRKSLPRSDIKFVSMLQHVIVNATPQQQKLLQEKGIVVQKGRNLDTQLGKVFKEAFRSLQNKRKQKDRQIRGHLKSKYKIFI